MHDHAFHIVDLHVLKLPPLSLRDHASPVVKQSIFNGQHAPILLCFPGFRAQGDAKALRELGAKHGLNVAIMELVADNQLQQQQQQRQQQGQQPSQGGGDVQVSSSKVSWCACVCVLYVRRHVCSMFLL